MKVTDQCLHRHHQGLDSSQEPLSTSMLTLLPADKERDTTVEGCKLESYTFLNENPT